MGENSENWYPSGYHWTDNVGGPDEERRRMKQLKEENDTLYFIADAQQGIPTKCPCGGKIAVDVNPMHKYKNDFNTLPGSRYFTCSKYEDNGFHFRQPWVFGVEEEIHKLIRKVDDQAKKIEEQSMKIEEMQIEMQTKFNV